MPFNDESVNRPTTHGSNMMIDPTFYRELFRSSPSAIAVTTREEGRIIDANDAMCRLTGYSLDEVVGNTTEALKIWENVGDRQKIVKIFEKEGHVLNFNTRVRAKDGRGLHVFVTGFPYTANNADLIIWQIIHAAEIGRMELLIAEREHSFRMLLNSLPGAAYKCLNDDGRTVVFISQGIRRMVGDERVDTTAERRMKLDELIHPDDRSRVLEEKDGALQRKREYHLTYRMQTPAGIIKWVLDHGSPVFNEKGEASVIEGFILDVSEQKRSELLVQRELTMNSTIAGLASMLMQPAIAMNDISELVLSYGKMATGSVDGVVLLGEGGRPSRLLDGGAGQLHGNVQGVDEEIALVLRDVADPDESSFSNKPPAFKVLGQARYLDFLNQAVKNFIHVPLSRTGELKGHIFLANSDREYDEHDVRVLESMGYLIQVAHQQVTTSTMLQQSESRYRGLIDAQGDMIVRWVPDGRIIFANDVFTRQSRTSVPQGTSKTMSTHLEADLVDELLIYAKEASPGKPTFEIETPLGGDVQNPLWIEWSNRALFDERGNLKEIQSVGRDITRRKNFETEIQRRINQEKFISIISASFVSSSFDDALGHMNEAVSLIGRYFDTDHCYVFQFNESRDAGTITTEWFSEPIPRAPRSETRIQLKKGGSILGKILNHESLSIFDVASLAAVDMSELELIALPGIKNLIYAPLHSEKKVIGYLGIERVRDGTIWNRMTAQGLLLLGEIFSQLYQRLQNERALRESEANFRAMFESAHDLIVIIDEGRKILWANPSLKKVTGYSMGQLGDPIEIIVPEDRPRALKAWDTVSSKQADSIQDLELKFVHASNDIHQMQVSIVRTELLGNNRYFISGRDITEQKQSELLLKQSQERYINLFDNMQNGVAIYRPDECGDNFIITDFNKAAERIDAITREAVIGKRVTEVFPGIRDSEIFNAFRSVFRSGAPVELGPVRYSDTRMSGWRQNYIYQLSSGEIVAVYSDVTEKMVSQEKIQQAEMSLRKSEEKYRLITEGSNDIISIVSRDFKIEYINESTIRLLGHRVDDLIGKTFLGFIYPDDIRKVFEAISGLRGNGSHEAMFEARFRHKTGELLWFETKTRKFMRENDTRMLFVSRDITSRKHAEDLFRDSESRYRTMLENASDIVSLLDQNLIYEFVNQNQLKILGYSNSDLIGKSIFEFIHPDDLECNIEEFMCDIQKGQGSVEFRLKHKNGGYIWFETKSTTYLDNHKKQKVLMLSRDVSESKKLKDELIHLNEDLEQRVIERTSALQDAQERLIRHEKLAAAGKIAGTISHELRNPLGAINNSVYFLRSKLAISDEKVTKHLNVIQREIDRATGIIANILDFTRIKQPEFTSGDLAPVIRAALSRVNIPSSIDVRVDVEPPNIRIRMDPALLEQAFLNVITNSVQAMQQGGLLSISARTSQRHVVLLFSDTGSGIDKTNLQRIFEPLFTTKSTGIGLGLVFVKDIIEKHGGEIQVESEVLKGTTFNILIPL